MEQVIEILKNIGLSEKEAKLYIVGLGIGEKTASVFAKKLGENRLTTYDLLKKLVKKGIATEVVVNGKHKFSMVPPDVVVNKFKHDIAIISTKLDTILPELNKLYLGKIGIKPKINVYEGFEGIKMMYEDSLKSDYQDVIIGKINMDPRFQDYLYNHFIPMRIKKGMKVRVIHGRPLEPSVVNNVGKEHLREVVVIDKNFFKIGNVIFMHSGNKISINLFSPHEMMGITIESKVLHDSFESIFNALWYAYGQSKK